MNYVTMFFKLKVEVHMLSLNELIPSFVSYLNMFVAVSAKVLIDMYCYRITKGEEE